MQCFLGVLLPFESISEYDNKQRITIKYQIEKMSGFVFFALVLTFVYVVYFAVMITLDLHGKKDEKRIRKKKPMMSVI